MRISIARVRLICDCRAPIQNNRTSKTVQVAREPVHSPPITLSPPPRKRSIKNGSAPARPKGVEDLLNTFSAQPEPVTTTRPLSPSFPFPQIPLPSIPVSTSFISSSSTSSLAPSITGNSPTSPVSQVPPTYGKAPSSSVRQVNNATMSIYSESGELQVCSPSSSPVKPLFEHTVTNASESSPTSPTFIPHVIVRSDSRSSGRYVAGPDLADDSMRSEDTYVEPNKQ